MTDEIKDFSPWNKWFWGTVGVVLLLGVLSTCDPAPALSKEIETNRLYQEVLLPSVQIDKNCSGTIINVSKHENGTQSFDVLTAKHCMKNKTEVGGEVTINVPVIVDNNHLGYAGVLGYVTRHASGDMTIISVLNTRLSFDLKPAEVVSSTDISQLYYGMDTVCLSYGAARGPILTKGQLGFLEYLENFGVIQRNSCPTIKGSSGSALFVDLPNDDRGYILIGTLTGGWGESFNFYSVASDVIKFLISPTLTVDPVFNGDKL